MCAGVHQEQHHRLGKRGDYPNLICNEVDSPAVLGEVLGTKIQIRYHAIGQHPEEDTRMVKNLEEKPYEKQLKLLRRLR